MKKLTRILFLVWLLIPLLIAAKPATSESTWFRYAYAQPAAVGETIDLFFFPQIQGSLFVNENGIFRSNYTGLVTLSGHCTVKHLAHWILTLHILDINNLELVNTTNRSGSFTITFMASPVRISFQHETFVGGNPTANGPACSLLFEKVR